MSELFYPQESVYDHLIPNEDEDKKPPRYVSKFRQVVVLENKSNKDSKRTMGPAKVDSPSPDKYLKKHSKEPKLSEKAECLKDTSSACACTARKPPVPARTDIPPMRMHTKRDFLKTTEAVPLKPKPTSIVNNVGDKQLLENSGLVPKYILKKDYGEVPAYIQQRRKVEQSAQEEYERFVEEQKEQVAMQHLSDEERHAVLQGLKRKWDEVNGVYQKLPLIIDTLSKKSHKIHLEEELSQLEKDIRLFERFTTIYISKN